MSSELQVNGYRWILHTTLFSWQITRRHGQKTDREALGESARLIQGVSTMENAMIKHTDDWVETITELQMGKQGKPPRIFAGDSSGYRLVATSNPNCLAVPQGLSTREHYSYHGFLLDFHWNSTGTDEHSIGTGPVPVELYVELVSNEWLQAEFHKEFIVGTSGDEM